MSNLCLIEAGWHEACTFLIYHTAMRAFLIQCFLILGCFSCSGQILVPTWYDYKADIHKHNWVDHKGITIIAENMEVNGQHLIFDVEIKNESDYRVRFNPEEMYYLGSDKAFPLNDRHDTRIGFESKLDKRFALSESQVADHFQNKIKSQKKTALVTGILSAGLVVFNTAMNVKAIHEDWTPKTQRRENLRNLLTFGSVAAMDVVRDQAAYSAMDARDDLYFLPQEIIEDGDIYPGQSFRGKVFFPITYDRYVRVIIPVGRSDFALDFRWADRKEERKLKRMH
jgi:hypothetical protein